MILSLNKSKEISMPIYDWNFSASAESWSTNKWINKSLHRRMSTQDLPCRREGAAPRNNFKHFIGPYLQKNRKIANLWIILQLLIPLFTYFDLPDRLTPFLSLSDSGIYQRTNPIREGVSLCHCFSRKDDSDVRCRVCYICPSNQLFIVALAANPGTVPSTY